MRRARMAAAHGRDAVDRFREKDDDNVLGAAGIGLTAERADECADFRMFVAVRLTAGDHKRRGS